MADAQVPWGLDALNGAVTRPAWRTKPSWYLVATDDRMIPPPAQRAMAEQAGATTTEAPGSHAIYVSRPSVVADVILEAARTPRGGGARLSRDNRQLCRGASHGLHHVRPRRRHATSSVAGDGAGRCGGDASGMLIAAIDPDSFLAVAAAGALAGTLATMITARGLLVPTVVAELVIGVVIGPQVLGVEVTDFMTFFADLGLGMLFFFAGYEIDMRRIAGLPLRLAIVGWAMSLAIAYSIGGLLAWAGIVLSLLYTGSALATTAIGTLIPVLSDTGELRTRLGTYLLAAGAVGEFGPILLLTLIPSTQSTIHNALILLAFVGLAAAAALLAAASSSPPLRLVEQTIEKSSQLAVRWIVVLVFALALLAFELGARPAARRLRGRRHHAPAAQASATCRGSTPSSRAWRSACSCCSSSSSAACSSTSRRCSRA